MSKKNPVHYVDDKMFFQSIKKWHEQRKEAIADGKEEPKIPEFCGSCIIKIANGLAQTHSFRNYSFVDDMKDDAIENCIRYFHNFNPDKYDKPFTYFTTISKYAFIRRIEEEEKVRYVRYASYDKANIFTEQNDGVQQTHVYENIAEFIERFENKQELKKQKRKEKLNENKPAPGLEAFMKEND